MITNQVGPARVGDVAGSRALRENVKGGEDAASPSLGNGHRLCVLDIHIHVWAFTYLMAIFGKSSPGPREAHNSYRKLVYQMQSHDTTGGRCIFHEFFCL